VQTGVRLVVAADTGIRKDELFFALLLLLPNIRTRTPCFIDGARNMLASNRWKRSIAMALALSAGRAWAHIPKSEAIIP
jgi:hypothetical protein